MSVDTQIDIVLAEEMECLSVLWHQIVNCSLPRCIRIVCRHVPCVVGDAEERNFRCLGILHRVGNESRQHIGNVQVVSVCGAHEQMVDAVVAYRIVEPDICLALNLVVNPCHVTVVYHIHNAVSGPHDIDVAVHNVTECGQIYSVCPSAVVLCRTNCERFYIGVRFFEFSSNVVHQFSLFVAMCSVVAPKVVPEYGKASYTKLAHSLELVNDICSVGIVPLYILTRVNCPHELYLVGFCHIYIFGDFVAECSRVLFAPFALVVCVIFWTVNIYVHLQLSEHLQKSHAVGFAVGIAIVTLNKSALRHAWVVGDGCTHYVWL